MFDKLITYSIENKFVIGLLVMALIIWGVYSLQRLPIEAVPDITNNQVQVITTSPSLATQEVEKFITTPIELSLQNIQQLEEIRSISRFGLSVVTIVFEENMDLYLARQLVTEHLKEASEAIPKGLGTPKMAPISTGLGEIYQYLLRPEKGYEEKYTPTELRTIQDWIVKRQLSGIEGVVEVNTLGGHLKQYEVAVDPGLLKSMGISLAEVYEALESGNENSGGAYIEKNPNTYYIRTNGIAQSLNDISHIVIAVRDGRPILVGDVAAVQFGKAPRYGAMTHAEKEVVGGTVMMLKGANSADVTERIKTKIAQVQKSLPEGVVIEPFLVRDKLISTAIGTVKKNLIEGGLIVIFILVLMLGNWRAGLIVASVIPLAMLFAVAMMRVLGISANLMSLGAIDFGLIVDGAVIMVEAIVHRLHTGFAGQKMRPDEMNAQVKTAALKIRNSAAFGEIIILMVYLPILALVGIEGKMFRPMAQTVMLAIGGALLLSLTYVPMMSALFLNKNISNKKTIADRIINYLQGCYQPILEWALRFKAQIVLATVVLFGFSMWTFSKMGGEFIPTLEEGDLALHQILPPGSSLSQSVAVSKLIQKKLKQDFPEVENVVTKIGSAEVPTDPMPIETGDIMVIMKPKSEWTSAGSRQEMFHKMEESLKAIPGLAYEFSQPIQMRFNELMTGSRADIAIKLFGDDLDLLYAKARETEQVIRQIPGIGTIKVEQTIGMPQIVIDYKYDKMAQYGLQVQEVNQMVRTAFAGGKAGTIYEGERRFDLVLRLAEEHRKDIENVEDLYITLDNGAQLPLTAIASVDMLDGPMQISREGTNRRIVIGVNVGNRDVESLVEEIQMAVDDKVSLPAGYFFTYGGQFENLKAAKARLIVVVPLALGLILILLYFTFGSLSQSLLIFTAIPLSAIGGIWALVARGMPFSISAGIGFIALFGVAVLNGIVLIGYFNQLKKEGETDVRKRIMEGTRVRLRPVLMTAAVASLGFLPMALSASGGAEVQRPLATVVIGGLITATFLTLIVLPILYQWLADWQNRRMKSFGTGFGVLVFLPLFFAGQGAFAQKTEIALDDAIEMALANHPAVRAASLNVQQSEKLASLPYSLGPTEIRYQGDGLFRQNGQQLNQFGVIQHIPNPGRIRAENQWQQEWSAKSKLDQQLTASGLKLQIRQLYFLLQDRKALWQFYAGQRQRYQSFELVAQSRTEMGEANRLELLTLQSTLGDYQLLEDQTLSEVHQLEEQLQLLLGTTDSLTASMNHLSVPFRSANGGVAINLKIAEQEIRIEQADTERLRAQKRPDFSLGFFAQNYFEGGWLTGLQAGVQVPLFNKQTNQRVEAQRLQMETVAANYEALQIQTNQRVRELLGTIEQYKLGLTYYQTKLEQLNPEVLRIATLNYEAGVIDYLELVNLLELLAKNRTSFLQQLLLHNQAVANYQFLFNQ